MKREKELEALYDLLAPLDGPTGWSNPRNSPHVWPQLQNGCYYSGRGVAISARCTDTSPRLPYVFRKDDVTSVVHWGQRKLLLAEVQFLTQYGHLSDTVVYAGAAPGTHMAALTVFFPQHRFYLYDPAPFGLDASDALVLRQEMFTDDVAASWAPEVNEMRKPVLFVCDIRSADFELVGTEESDKRIREDMAAQKRWTQLMKPAMASLKFRLPWGTGHTRYLDGDLHFQVWAPPKSTEGRLFTDGLTEREYDDKQYEDQCFYHNTVVRLATHPHDIVGVRGMDHCGDCAAEAQILGRYMERFGLPDQTVAANVAEGIGALMTLVTEGMRGARTLEDVVDAQEQKRRIQRNQWIKTDPLGPAKPAYLAESVGREYHSDEERTAAEELADVLMSLPSVAERLALVHAQE